MSYHDTATRSTLTEALQHMAQGLGHGFSSFGKALMENSAGNRRLSQVRALQAKSDAELATLNIKRDEIVDRVFGRSF